MASQSTPTLGQTLPAKKSQLTQRAQVVKYSPGEYTIGTIPPYLYKGKSLFATESRDNMKTI